MNCDACGGPYHESTGHLLSEDKRLCGVCARDFVKWLSGHLKRRWGGADFYVHAATSIRAGDPTLPSEPSYVRWTGHVDRRDGRPVV